MIDLLAEVSPTQLSFTQYRAELHRGLRKDYTLPYRLISVSLRSIYPTPRSYRPVTADCEEVAQALVNYYISAGKNPLFSKIVPVGEGTYLRPLPLHGIEWSEHTVCLPEPGVVDDPVLPSRLPVAEYLAKMFGDSLLTFTTYKPHRR